MPPNLKTAAANPNSEQTSNGRSSIANMKCVPVLAASCGATGKPWGSCSSLQRTPSSPSPLEPLASRRSTTDSAPKVIFWKRRLSTTTPIWRPSPRSRRLVLKIGALDSQSPLYWRPNVQQRKMESSMVRSHTSPHPCIRSIRGACQSSPPPFIMLLSSNT